MYLKLSALFCVALLNIFVGQVRAQDAESLVKAAHLAMYYSGDDGIADVVMQITNKKGKVRERVFTILRKDFVDGGEQRIYVYFHKPNDVKRMTFMTWKDPDADDSRWIYIPSLDLVKSISSNDKKSSFVGSDFSYEDISGRHWSEDKHKILREEKLNGVACYVIESVPNSRDYFAKKLSWIEKERTITLKEEFYDKKDKIQKIFEVGEYKEFDGILTTVSRTMTTPGKNNVTTITFSDIRFNQGIAKEIFSERYLKSPPREYIK